MKIRTGFVSNSSSSSYVVSEKDFPSVKSVAEYIAKDIIRKGLEENDKPSKLTLDIYRELLENIQNGTFDPNITIVFHYYDGYTIQKLGDQYYIDGTRHHELEENNKFHYVGESFYEDNFGYYVPENYDKLEPEVDSIYLANFDIIAEDFGNGFCKKHFIDNYIINGKNQCPECYANEKKKRGN